MLTVSIITVCRNAEEVLEPTIRSVLSQTYPDIEYLIIDGASADRTLEIVKRYGNRIARIISEPDQGIYDAMNKGIAAATGEIVYFLNAGDRLADATVIETLARAFESPETQIVYGRALYDNIPNNVGQRYHQRNFRFRTKMDVARHVSPQQCFFYRREVFTHIGTFDTRFPTAADMDWFLRSLTHKIPNYFLDTDICICNLGGVSSRSHVRERIAVFYKNMRLAEFVAYSVFALSRQIIRAIHKERLN